MWFRWQSGPTVRFANQFSLDPDRKPHQDRSNNRGFKRFVVNLPSSPNFQEVLIVTLFNDLKHTVLRRFARHEVRIRYMLLDK